MNNLLKGFFANGLHCGIKKNGKKDLSIFYSGKPCVASGVFTKNIFKAAPVIVSQKNIKNKIHAIVANSGCANACTGKRGIDDAKKICELTAAQLNVKPENILVASTGVIGQYLPMEKIKTGIKKLVSQFHNSRILEFRKSGIEQSAVEGIMTTDTFPKIAFSTCHLPSAICHIWACAKGSGMIEPNLATMLSFILTDAQITKDALNRALKIATEKSFNCLTIDGDTSTNDTVFALANGAAKNKLISDGKNFQLFCAQLTAVCIELTKMLARDGEGATKLITVNVRGTKNITDAKKIAKTIANSPLVKTAIFGNDANWGRIIAAIGRSGIKVNADRTDILFGNIYVFKNGSPVSFSEKKVKNIIMKKEISINVNLKKGKKSVTIFTCDLTDKYVKINACYRT